MMCAQTLSTAADVPGPFMAGTARTEWQDERFVVRFNWEPAAGAREYRLQVLFPPETGAVAERRVRSNACEVEFPGRSGEEYAWHVEALGPAGETVRNRDGERRFVVPPQPKGIPSVVVPRMKGTAPQIDGVLGPGEWEGALTVVFDTTLSGRMGEDDTFPVWRAMWDEEALYMAVQVWFPGGRPVDAVELERDGAAWGGDALEFFLRGPGRNTYYHFIVNARNSIYDSRSGNAGWNGEWRHAAQVEGSSMVIEVAVPFESIGEKPAVGDEWHGNVIVDMNGQSLTPAWVKTSGFHTPNEWGTMVLGK